MCGIPRRFRCYSHRQKIHLDLKFIDRTFELFLTRPLSGAAMTWLSSSQVSLYHRTDREKKLRGTSRNLKMNLNLKLKSAFQGSFRNIFFVFLISTFLGSQLGCSLIEKSMKKSSRKGPVDEDTSSARAPSPTHSTQGRPTEAADLPELRDQISLLEKRLETKKEKEQYSKILPWFKSNSEQIEFLKQPNLETRNQWILKNKIYTRSNSPSPEMKALIGSQDIALGMPADFVIKSWGEPIARDISGNPLNRNERWKYLRTLATSDGYRQEKRFVYFEGGKVVGWETE